MKLYVDLNGDRHYLLTDDGEAVYVDELQEDGRDTEYLSYAIEAARRGRRVSGVGGALKPLDVETFGPESEELARQ